jgi:P4 family phage/plasmid primase-like protien
MTGPPLPEPGPCPYGWCVDGLPPVSQADVERYGLGAVALGYAAMGLAVFPLKVGSKEPAIGDWDENMSRAPAVITSPDWWGGNNFYGIAIPTGQVNRLLGTDLDNKYEGRNGYESFPAWLAERGLTLPLGLWVSTPHLGAHLRHWLPPGRAVRSRNEVLPGVDIKADGGYIVAPPTNLRELIRPGPEDSRSREPAEIWVPYASHGCVHQTPDAPSDFLDAQDELEGHSSGGHGGGNGDRWTNPDIGALTERGVPDDVTYQRPYFRDLCYKLAQQGVGKEEAWAIWQQVAARTTLIRPSEPWDRASFDREWRGAPQEVARRAEQDAAVMTPGVAAWAAGTVPQQDAGQPPDVVTGLVIQPPKVVLPKTGLDATKAAGWVLGQGPLLYGIDHQFWAYTDGVWVPGEVKAADIVHQRATRLLGRDYRQAHESNTKEVIRGMVGALACDPVPELINFRDGLLRWRSSDVLEQHHPAVLSTVQLAVKWNRQAGCSRFDRFLGEVLAPGDVPRMWEVIGYLLMSGNPLHKMIMLFGRGFNGKGTLLRVITALLGEPNVSAVTLHALSEERFAPIRLLGKTANICGDIDARYIEHTGMLKQLTGEDLISGEHKFRDSATFTSWAVPVFSANEIPASSDTSLGWRERWEVFHFPRTFAPGPSMEAALMTEAELEGIAAHGVTALRELMARTPLGFARTAAGDAAKAGFIAHQDPLAGWLTEECQPAEGAWTDQRNAYESYRAWCERSGTKNPVRKLRFYELMRERFAVAMHDGWPGFSRLALRSSWIPG